MELFGYEMYVRPPWDGPYDANIIFFGNSETTLAAAEERALTSIAQPGRALVLRILPSEEGEEKLQGWSWNRETDSWSELNDGKVFGRSFIIPMINKIMGYEYYKQK
jgi:hypothetical protein